MRGLYVYHLETILLKWSYETKNASQSKDEQ